MKLISVMIWLMLISGVWLSSVQSPTILTEKEQVGLQSIYEQGKLARAAALEYYATWESPIFRHIAENKQVQLEALKILRVRYDLPSLPPGQVPPQAANQGVATKNVLEAMEMMAQIEENTIQQLQQIRNAPSNRKDITDVYEKLLRGSRNHLRVLVQTLKTQHISYAPKFLKPAIFDAIIGSDQEH